MGTYLATQGYRIDGPDPDEALAAQLDSYALQVEQLLRILQALGSVMICTNAESGWVELTCRKFLPRIESVVAGIEKQSARSEYEAQGISNPLDWKKHAFAKILCERRMHNVFSVGDSSHERAAIIHACHMVGDPMVFCKSLKFLERPDLCGLACQYAKAVEEIAGFVSHEDHLDLYFCVPSYRGGLRGVGDLCILAMPQTAYVGAESVMCAHGGAHVAMDYGQYFSY